MCFDEAKAMIESRRRESLLEGMENLGSFLPKKRKERLRKFRTEVDWG